MRIPKDSKIGVAMAVLRAIKMKASDVSVDVYSNCREQGFFVSSYYKNAKWNERRAVSFAENRNSDEIIVQFGIKDKDFNDYGVLSEKKYKTNKKHFSCGEYEKAGEFARKWLMKLI